MFTERTAKGLIELRREALLALTPDEEPALERLAADRAMRRALTELLGRSNGPFLADPVLSPLVSGFHAPQPMIDFSEAAACT
ncbi:MULTISPECIES: hypothetical protein [Streptomyces]|uniref:hypothetical protein n=1 Tax=Streptomyces TaxID=1883 RepID=UPI000B204412|nr:MULTISPECIES: hypothetical protein [Streptomyces]